MDSSQQSGDSHRLTSPVVDLTLTSRPLGIPSMSLSRSIQLYLLHVRSGHILSRCMIFDLNSQFFFKKYQSYYIFFTRQVRTYSFPLYDIRFEFPIFLKNIFNFPQIYLYFLFFSKMEALNSREAEGETERELADTFSLSLIVLLGGCSSRDLCLCVSSSWDTLFCSRDLSISSQVRNFEMFF